LRGLRSRRLLANPSPLPGRKAPGVDIRPDPDLNAIHPESRGVVPVAVLGSGSFDVTDVDVTQLTFGPAGASPSNRRGPHFGDLNGDDLTDLILHFRVEESGIAFGDTMACLAGETLNGTPFGVVTRHTRYPDIDSITRCHRCRRRQR
jgi:hypothetical protein